MREAKTPLGDIPSLYSLAANGDQSAEFRLVMLYKDYIKALAGNLQEQYGATLEMEYLLQEGAVGILNSLKWLSLSLDCPTYASWIEENIKKEILRRIFSEMRISDSRRAPHDI